jgi:ABC-type sugar transport system ATPase subunit
MKPILSVKDVSRAFGHVQALKNVDLDVFPGQTLGLLGDNGAGKSTLIKVISGVCIPDEGKFTCRGQEVRIEDPSQAQGLGIATIYQELSLVDTRPVAHNIWLGREPRRWGIFIDLHKMERDAKEILGRLGITLPSVSVDVEVLSGGQRQAVAIARAISQGGDILLMDEPWASLGVEQRVLVQRMMKDLKGLGKAIVLVTHDLSNILEITDKIAVLRQGKLAAYADSKSTSIQEIIGWITGALAGTIPEKGV